MTDIISSSSKLPEPSPDIEEALLTAASNHSLGTHPIEMLFLFTLSPSGNISTTILGASKPLVIRGLIAELHDCLDMVEADIIDKLHD